MSLTYNELSDKIFLKQIWRDRSGNFWVENNGGYIEAPKGDLDDVGEQIINNLLDALQLANKGIIEDNDGRHRKITFDDKIIYVRKFLKYLEVFNSCHIIGSRYDKAKKAVFDFIKKEISNADSNQKQSFYSAIKEFISVSLDNIPANYRGKNAIEPKDDYRAAFIADMLQEDVINFKFLVDSRELLGFRDDQISNFFGKRKLLSNWQEIYLIISNKFFAIAPNEEKAKAVIEGWLADVDKMRNDIPNRTEALKIFYDKSKETGEIRENNKEARREAKEYFFKKANSEDLAQFFIEENFWDNYRDKCRAIGNMDLDEVSNFSIELLLKLFSVHNLPTLENGSGLIAEDTDSNNPNARVKYINPKLFSKLEVSKQIKLLLSQDIKYRIPLQSSEIVNLYPYGLTFENLESLNQRSLVNSEDVIKIIKFFDRSTYEERQNMKAGLTRFYSLDRILEIINKYKNTEDGKTDGKVPKKFIEDFNRFTQAILSLKERDEYFKRLSNDLNQREDKDDLIIDLGKNGINLGTDIRIDTDAVLGSNTISTDDIFVLYNSGTISGKTFIELFSNFEDAKKAYLAEKLDISALTFYKEGNNFVKGEYNSGNIDEKKLIHLYAMEKEKVGIDEEEIGGIDIETLNELIGEKSFNEGVLAEYIPDTILPEKVKLLFLNYFISQSDLFTLVGRGIITELQEKEFASQFNFKEIMEKLKKSGAIVVEDQPSETGTGGTHQADSDKSKIKQKENPDYRLKQEELVGKIGFDMEALKVNAKNNSLFGYRIYLSEDLDIMLFFPPQSFGNATFIMSKNQGGYFLITENKTGNEKINTFDINKGTIRDLGKRNDRYVRSINYAKGWGKNVIDAMKKVSEKFKENYNKRDDEYKNNLNRLCKEISDKYIPQTVRQ